MTTNMVVSLKNFLQTGVFADLLPLTPREEVLRRLGEPNAFGGTSRKYRQPSTYLYGSVELYMTQTRPYVYKSAFWDADEKGDFRFSSRYAVEDWDWVPGTSRQVVEQYLHTNGLSFDLWPDAIDDMTYLRVLPSGVCISISEDSLYSVSTPAR